MTYCLQAAARIGVASLEAGDAGTCDALRLQADCINLPRLGDACNYAFPTMQMNIAATQKAAADGSGTYDQVLPNCIESQTL